MRGKEPECQPCSTCGTHRGGSQAPTPAHSHQPSTASSPPDVVDRGAEVMGPVGKSAMQAVFGAVAFRVCLVDADSSLVVAQVVPALSVPCGPVQERAPETWKWGSLTFAPGQPSTVTGGYTHSGSKGASSEPCCGSRNNGPLPVRCCSLKGAQEGMAPPLHVLWKATQPEAWAPLMRHSRRGTPGGAHAAQIRHSQGPH